MTSQRKAVVIGGGFSGLITSYFLIKKGYKVTLYESSNRLGGLIHTENTKWGLAEEAASSLIPHDILQTIFKDIKLDILPSSSIHRARYFYRQKLTQWPLKFQESIWFLIKLFIFLLKFFSTSILPKKGESLSTWSQRNFGIAFTQFILSPAFQGVYATSSKNLSSSLIMGPLLKKISLSHLWVSLTQRKKNKENKIKGVFSTQGGVGFLIETLKNYLISQGVEIHLNHHFEFPLSHPPSIPHFICTSAPQAAQLLSSLDPLLSQKLKAIQLLPLISATLFLKKSVHETQGFGVLFPENEGFSSLGVLFMSSIFDEREKNRVENWILKGEDNLTKNESEIIEIIFKDRARFLKSQKDDLLGWYIKKWDHSIPRYDTKLEEVLSNLHQPKNIYLIGNYLGGIGLTKIALLAQSTTKLLS